MRTNVARHMYRRRDANRADDTRIAIAVARFDAVAFADARIDDDDSAGCDGGRCVCVWVSCVGFAREMASRRVAARAMRRR